MNRIDSTFSALKDERAALMPYLPLGYPTVELSRALIHTAQDAGADLLELGVPFSDPLADGPVIQHAAQVALENGMNLQKCLDMVQEARADGVTIPLVLMGYYNPILRYDVGSFARNAREAGVDGVIVPDLPIAEAKPLREACSTRELDIIFLAAPTSSDARLRELGEAARGFLYLVSLTGVTGMREGMPERLEEFVARARRATSKPLCVGFGISNAENARRVAALADGVIVGSALVAKIGEAQNTLDNARAFIAELRAAVG